MIIWFFLTREIWIYVVELVFEKQLDLEFYSFRCISLREENWEIQNSLKMKKPKTKTTELIGKIKNYPNGAQQ